LGEDFPEMKKIIVYNEPRRREVDGVSIIPVDEFFREIWSGEIIVG
jgi:hypothetical protein